MSVLSVRTLSNFKQSGLKYFQVARAFKNSKRHLESLLGVSFESGIRKHSVISYPTWPHYAQAFTPHFKHGETTATFRDRWALFLQACVNEISANLKGQLVDTFARMAHADRGVCEPIASDMFDFALTMLVRAHFVALLWTLILFTSGIFLFWGNESFGDCRRDTKSVLF